MKSVNELKPGETGTILSLDVPEKLKHRLTELGICEDADVRLLGCAPLGDPLILEINGSIWALRQEACRNILLL